MNGGDIFMVLWLIGLLALPFTPWALVYLLVLVALVLSPW